MTSDTPKVSDDQSHTVTERTFFGQPWGLANLFNIELWERFSFYGMNSLLAFYMYYAVTDGGLGMDQPTAVALVGAYGGFVYLAALAGSFVSDRLIGPEPTLFYSAILVMLGHIALALLPGYGGLTVGLLCVGIGSGGVKTCSQVVLGDLYSRDDPRRDAGFSIYYLAVNIGALAGPLLTGFAWKGAGFHLGFGLAAIGMAIGLGIYTAARKQTISAASSEVPNPLPRSHYLPWIAGTLVVIAVVVGPFVTGLIPAEEIATVMTLAAGIAGVILLIQMGVSPKTTAVERSRLIGYLPLLVGCIGFFAIFQSQFTVLAVYADMRADLPVVLGHEVTPNMVQLINPMFIIIFSGIFAAMWTKLGDRQWSSPMKFGIANIVIGLSLFIFLPFSTSGEDGTPFYPLVLILFLFTMGELLLSPVGNSLATKVAPEKFKSTMFAVWLIAVSMGTSLSGELGTYYDPTDPAAERTFFVCTAAAAIVLGLLLIASRRWVLKKFHGIR